MNLITLKTLTLHNFMGYKGDTTLDFHGKDITGILAEYEEDKTRSNRGGKSTILEAIGYNLTGLSRTKDESKLIHHGQKEMWVIGVYTDGDRDYTIKRGRDHKSKGILELDWIQKVSEVEEEIEKIFGITPKDFHLTSFFKQADTEGFMKMKPSEKSAFLMKWLDNEHWKEKEERANEDRKIVKQKLRDNENLKKALEASLEIDESLVSQRYEIDKENKELAVQRDELAQELAEINNNLKNLNKNRDDVISKMNALKSEKRDIETSLSKFEEDTVNYNNCRKEYARLKKELEAIDVSIDEKTQNEKLDKLKEKRSKLKNILNVATEHKGGVCPILQSSCDRLKADPKEIEAAKKELEDVSASIKIVEKTISDNRLKQDISNKMVNQAERGKRFKERLDKKPELETRLEEIIHKLPELSDAVASLNISDLTEKKNELSSQIKELEDTMKANGKKMLDIDVRVEEARRAKEKIDTVVASNEELQRKLTNLNYVCFMFSKNGIPSLEIENSFTEIEDNINWILDNILTGVQVSFSPDKELKALEPVCTCGFQFPKGFRGNACPECDSPRQNQRREEIAFKIIENGVEQDFEMDSGGGKQIISYAVRIALTMLKRAQNKCNLNMLFLDEVDSALDPYLASQVIGSVTNFLTKKLGYQQVILVSHKEQIKSSVPHIIKVMKHDTYSTARFV